MPAAIFLPVCHDDDTLADMVSAAVAKNPGLRRLYALPHADLSKCRLLLSERRITAPGWIPLGETHKTTQQPEAA